MTSGALRFALRPSPVGRPNHDPRVVEFAVRVGVHCGMYLPGGGVASFPPALS